MPKSDSSFQENAKTKVYAREDILDVETSFDMQLQSCFRDLMKIYQIVNSFIFNRFLLSLKEK